jgi:hypothetical protein
MKTPVKFLAGVAALFLAIGAAHADDTCYEVLRTPDNFLAMRGEPTAKSKMIGALREGDIVKDLDVGWNKDGTKPKFREKWMKVVTIDEHAKWNYAGWVYKKYIKEIPCCIGTVRGCESEEPEPKCDIPGCDETLPRSCSTSANK